MSIIDRREIEFDGKALISLIAGSLQRAQTIGLPALRPIRIGFSPQAREIRVEYEAHAAVSVASDRLGALLVAYCVRTRIPISRQADKDIRIEAGSVFLTFATFCRCAGNLVRPRASACVGLHKLVPRMLPVLPAGVFSKE